MELMSRLKGYTPITEEMYLTAYYMKVNNITNIDVYEQKVKSDKLENLILEKNAASKILEVIKKIEIEEIKKEFMVYLENYGGIYSSITVTPSEIVKLICELGNSEERAKMLDLYSGTGKFEEEVLKTNKDIEIKGFEINDRVIEIAKVRCQEDEKLKYCKKDIFSNLMGEEKFDFIVADPPFGVHFAKNIENNLEEEYKNLGLNELNSKKRTTETWLTAVKILNSLTDDGIGIMTSMKGSLFNTLDCEIRRSLIEKDYISKIIDLPANLYSNTNIPVSIIVLEKCKKNKEIEFIDLSNCFIRDGRKNRLDLDRCIATIKNDGIKISKDKVLQNDSSLNIDAYKYNVVIENGITLGDVVIDIFRGYQITSSQIKEMLVDNPEEKQYRILEIGNVDNDGNIDKRLNMIKSNGKNLDRYLLRKGDIILSARGDKIKKAIIMDDDYNDTIANGSINVIRVDVFKMNPLYLKTFLDSDKGNNILNSIKAGVTIPSLNVGPLQRIVIPCPPLEIQKEKLKKIETKLEIIKSTTQRLDELKKEFKDLSNQL